MKPRSLLLAVSLGASVLATAQPLPETRQSHIEGNVPRSDALDAMLRRSLLGYFRAGQASRMPRGGLVKVSVDKDPLIVELTVAETGIGIPESLQSALPRLSKKHRLELAGTVNLIHLEC